MLIPYEECKAVWDNCPTKLNQCTAIDRIRAKTGYTITAKSKNQVNAHFRRYKEETYGKR